MSSRLPPKYTKFDMVSLRRDASQRGVIWAEPIRTEQGWQYQVFFTADDIRFFSEEDLKSSVDKVASLRYGRLIDLHRRLLLVKTRHPMASYLFGLRASRTKFEVYQFKPALKFLGNPDQRLLIADEVGLGKTIEAGIIYLEMQARIDLKRVLVVCPPSLMYKWQDEFSARFDEQFHILNTGAFRNYSSDYDRMGEHARLRGIMSMHSIRRKEIAEEIAQKSMHFDLVIVDEAHHARNPTTLTHGVMSVLSDNADAMLLLTATPLHLGNQDLFHLLRLLSPGEFNNLEAFRQMIEPNAYVNQASRYLSTGQISQALRELRRVEHMTASRRFVGNPYYRQTRDLLTRKSLDRDEMVRAQRNLLELNTLAHIFTRTRKREVVENAPIRMPHTLRVEFSDEEMDFYRAVIDHVREQYRAQTGNNASGWVTSMRERQVASCVSAARSHFEDLLDHRYNLTSEELNLLEGEIDIDSPNALRKIVLDRKQDMAYRMLVNAGKRAGRRDSKFEVFVHSIQNVLRATPESKILVFSFFRGTLDYLYSQMQARGLGVRVIHGGVSMEERKKIVESFREDPRIQILLSSEVGSEGLDFQFCNTLINYDLPWNPMRLEQRIGRLDRFGQKSPRINIYNLVIVDTIEERIFLRLYERIGIFKEAIGDLEAILGEEIRTLSNQIYSQKLSTRQEEQLAERAINNIVRRKQELEDFEKERLQFMGQDVIFQGQVQNTIRQGKFISEAELRALVETFIRKEFPDSRWEADPDDPTYSLVPRDDLINHIKTELYRNRKTDRTSQEFLKRLNPGRPIPITFSDEVAYERKLLEFITLRHPLAQIALDYWNNLPADEQLEIYEVSMDIDQDYNGDCYFFIYSIIAKGITDQSELFVVVQDIETGEFHSAIGQDFLRYLQETDIDHPVYGEKKITRDTFWAAEEAANRMAASERDRKNEELEESNESLVNARLSALEQTYMIKSDQVKKLLRESTDPSIRRMREGQLRNIKSGYEIRVAEIRKQEEIEVSFRLELGGIAHLKHRVYAEVEDEVLEGIEFFQAPEEEKLVVEPEFEASQKDLEQEGAGIDEDFLDEEPEEDDVLEWEDFPTMQSVDLIPETDKPDGHPVLDKVKKDLEKIRAESKSSDATSTGKKPEPVKSSPAKKSQSKPYNKKSWLEKIIETIFKPDTD